MALILRARSICALASFAALTIAACDGPASKDAGSDVKIVGGSRVTQTNKWDNAVAITNNGSTFCTGTLVHPRLVITAAHCLDDKSGKERGLRVVAGPTDTSPRQFRVEKVAINPKYVDNALTDVAYLRLAQDAVGVEIIPIANKADEVGQLLKPGARSTLVGFGTTDDGRVGTKFEAETFVGTPEDGALFIGGDGKDTCQGDSGGPAYGKLANGKLRVYGITSRGAGCGGGGTYARMTDEICWLQQDSGIAIAGIGIPCRGIVNPPLPDEFDARAMKIALGKADDAAVDAYQLGFAVPAGAASALIILSKTGGGDAAPALTATLVREQGGLKIYRTDRAITLSPDLELQVVALDAKSIELGRTKVRFSPITKIN